MKLDIDLYTPPDANHPWDPTKFVEHYNRLIKALLSSQRNSFTDLILAQRVSNTISNGVPFNVVHRLNTRDVSLALSGRVQAYQVKQTTSTSITIQATLWSTRLVNPMPNVSTDKLEVEDLTLFRVGDILNIGGKEATIKTIQNVQAKTLTLTAPVIYPKNTYNVTLAQDNVTFTIF